MKRAHVIGGVLVLGLLMPAQAAGPAVGGVDQGSAAADFVLMPTAHLRVPADLGQLWFAPEDPRRVSGTDVSAAMRQVAQAEYAKALPVLSRPASQQGILGHHVMYDMALAQLKLGRAEDAHRAFRTLRERQPAGYLSEAAALAEAEAAGALGRWSEAIAIYERLLKGKPLAPDEVLMRLGRAAKAAGQAPKANEAFLRVYYEFALGPLAAEAGGELARVNLQAIEPGSERFRLELGRAERLFAARQYGPARTAFESLRASARGDDRELVALRIAESNYYLKRLRDAREGLRPYLKDASRQGEALFFFAITVRELGDVAQYLETIRRVANEFPEQTWSAEALNNLATHHILRDEDAQADGAFRELLQKHPKGPHAERAAWKVGWLAYRERRYRDTVAFFERAAAAFPRSDYRPSWLYWSGRAREELNDPAGARAILGLALTDYLNSYYGRLAIKRPGVVVPAGHVVLTSNAVLDEGEEPMPPPPPTAALIRALASAGLYDHARSELRYAQRTWGDSPAIQATLAWISYQQGVAEAGNQRFALLRGSINGMRRAYPQFMAAGGENLPREILGVIFPLAYWDQIRKYSAAHKLDPYLMAALMAQESTFVPDVRSSANAVGLMQLIPSTARQMARKLGLRYSASLLTNPETNIRMGMTYFADKMQEFGAVHLALASYNAGEGAVRQWIRERPGIPVDEFIDDIPYPETQNYVKRIIGTAEDYRRLYQ